jgi:hypothetical protein
MPFASLLSGGLLPVLLMLSPFAVMAAWEMPHGDGITKADRALACTGQPPLLM